MAAYVGIDLGTTNSAICSFDGCDVVIHKSPEQTDVTPSAIYVDKRGKRQVGLRAYNNAARYPENAATLFKRLIGTSTPIRLPAVDLTMTPEECSSEVLRTLFSYLPEAIRNDPDLGTVITIPAAFSQIQKDATTEAAHAAGIGKVALMQEPVAAVMSVMRSRRSDGTFLVFDLGGGTLDVAIAQSSRGKVSLLSQGGIAMCGGRDFDRRIFDDVVSPWLREKFDLPENFVTLPEYRSLRRMAEHAAEKAKVALSSQEVAIVSAQEEDIRLRDRSGIDIYLDLEITRERVDALIEDKVAEAVQAARDAVSQAGVSLHDIERVVFVGGPTQYAPLRTKVAFELGVAGSTDVDPMTAVAAGAAIYAESVDWSSQGRVRKSSRGTISAGSGLDMRIAFVARTSDSRAKVAMKLASAPLEGTAFQVDSLDTGWSSGRAALRNEATLDVPLSRDGENAFKVFVFDPSGGPVALDVDKFAITKTAATIDAIPASHSIGLEVLDGISGQSTLDWLVRAGESLPKQGTRPYRAGQSLAAGALDSLRFKLWEGDIEHPPADNRFVGLFEIEGKDIPEGTILSGAALTLRYEIRDSGVIEIDVDVPSLQASFSKKNFYARKSAQRDLGQEAARVLVDAEGIEERIAQVAAKVSDKRLDAARERVARARSIGPDNPDPEAANQASQDLLQAKRLLAQARTDHLPATRRSELESATADFDNYVRGFATPSEVGSFERLVAAASKDIFEKKSRFETSVRDIRRLIYAIFRRQDFFVVDRFNRFADEWSHLFVEREPYDRAVMEGRRMLAGNDLNGLRQVLGWLEMNCTYDPPIEASMSATNVMAG